MISHLGIFGQIISCHLVLAHGSSCRVSSQGYGLPAMTSLTFPPIPCFESLHDGHVIPTFAFVPLLLFDPTLQKDIRFDPRSALALSCPITNCKLPHPSTSPPSNFPPNKQLKSGTVPFPSPLLRRSCTHFDNSAQVCTKGGSEPFSPNHPEGHLTFTTASFPLPKSTALPNGACIPSVKRPPLSSFFVSSPSFLSQRPSALYHAMVKQLFLFPFR